MSNNIITIFIVEFLILAVLACVEKNWGMVLYGWRGDFERRYFNVKKDLTISPLFFIIIKKGRENK